MEVGFGPESETYELWQFAAIKKLKNSVDNAEEKKEWAVLYKMS